MSLVDPLRVLFDEHQTIVAALLEARELALALKGSPEAKARAHELLAFFRTYADQFHHQKEEQVLFPEMAKRDELLRTGVLQELLEQHEDFRLLIREIERNLLEDDLSAASANILLYVDELFDHIAVENDELFSAASDLFTEDELRALYFRFADLDSTLGRAEKAKLERSATERYADADLPLG